jgi:hypothetical protein
MNPLGTGAFLFILAVWRIGIADAVIADAVVAARRLQ